MTTGTQKDLQEHLLVEYGIECSAAAISKRVKAENYCIIKTPGGRIKIEETAKALKADGFPKSNFKGRPNYRKSEPVKKKKKDSIDFNIDLPEIDLDEKVEPGFPEYTAGWIGGDWQPYILRADYVLNTVEFELWDHEQGRYSDLDVLAVIVETVCEYLRVVEDHRTGKKYKPDELIEGDDPISIDSKKRAIEYCRQLIEVWEPEIEELKQ